MPDGITILGQLGLKEIGRKRHFDPSRGPVDTIIYEGTHEDVQAAEASIAGANLIYECDYTLGNPKARFTITTPDFIDNTGGDGLIATNYELVNSPQSRSGYEHPKADITYNGSASVSEAQMREIKKAVKAERAPSASIVPNPSNAYTLYEHMRKGKDSYFSWGATFRVVHIISKIATVAVSYLDVGRAYSSQALILETGASGIYAAAINAAYNNFEFRVPPGHTLGWLKTKPSFNTVAGNRVAVTIEYYLEAWSDFYYTD